MNKPDKRYSLIIAGFYLLPHIFYAAACPLLIPDTSDGILFTACFRPYFWAHVFSPLCCLSPIVAPVFFLSAVLAGCLFSGYRWVRITTIVILVLQYLFIAYNTLFLVLFSLGHGFRSA